jgi:dipeptidyl aminopeptidase/acylaminoacyl peptidase
MLGLFGALAVSAFTATDEVGAALSTSPTARGAGLIAYAGPDGRIRIVRADGTGERTLSAGGGSYSWPTWAPDGRRVAYSGVLAGSAGAAQTLELYLGDIRGGPATVVLTNPPGAGPILPEVPYYVLWSPGGDRMAIIANAAGGLSLFVHRPGSPSPPAPILRTSPLYAAWSGDARFLLVHGDARHYLVADEPPSDPKLLPEASARYRAPAWLPGTARATFVAADEAGAHRLVTRDLTTEDDPVPWVAVPRPAAFLWSPDGQVLAVAQEDAEGRGYGGVTFYSAEGTRLSGGLERPVLAFFWSPDGGSLACVIPGDARGALRWLVLRIETGETRRLAEFIPTPEQLTLLRYFDQFAYSHGPWSPDGRALVFAGRLATPDDRAPFSDTASDGVFVQRVAVGAQPRRVGSGRMGVWSPRQPARRGASPGPAVPGPDRLAGDRDAGADRADPGRGGARAGPEPGAGGP